MNQIDLPEGPFFLPPISFPTGGVDFLGLRQTNLDMMSACIPAINNVTWFVRPYALVAWIFWKFHALCHEQDLDEPTDAQMKIFMEKIEIMFTWGAMLENAGAAIPGKGSKLPPTKDGWVPLTFSAWKRTARNTSLMAPVTYGPSSKTHGGFGFLESVRSGFFRPSGPGVAMAEALDEVLSKAPDDCRSIIQNMRAVKGSEAQARSLWKLWSVFRPTKREKRAFRSAFASDDAVGDYSSGFGCRSSMAELIREVLHQAGTPMDVDEIRRALVHGQLDDGRNLSIAPSLVLARLRWAVLQFRQLQRLALEAIMAWVERRVRDDGDGDSDRMVQAGLGALKKGGIVAADATFGDLIDRLGEQVSDAEELLAAGAINEELSLFAVIEALRKALRSGKGKAIVAHAFHGLALVVVAVDRLSELSAIVHELRAGGPRRLSLHDMNRRLREMKSQSMGDVLRYVLETMVLSQHFSTAVNRYDGQTQRLRLTLEEDGLVMLATKSWRPELSADRLAVCLSLMSDCGMIRWNHDNKYSA